MKLSNKLYDDLKWIAQILLPALATLYFALSKIWGLPYGEEIVGTISAIDVFLGALLGLSTAKYYKENRTTILDLNKDDGLKDLIPEDKDNK